MRKIKVFSFFILSFMSVFTLGAYATCVRFGIKPVEPHQWILTSFFGLMFFVMAIDGLRKL